MCTAFHDAWGPAKPIVVAQHRITCRIARPVVTGGDIGPADQRASGRIRAGQHVMDIGLVACAIHHAAFLVERSRLPDIIAIALKVAVEIGDVGRDQLAFGTEPAVRSEWSRTHPASR
jgi:hypothetical protein